MILPFIRPAAPETIRILEVKIPASAEPTVLVIEVSGPAEQLATVKVRTFQFVSAAPPRPPGA